MRLMEVVCPGTEDVRVEGISENQYREFNEFPLSEQSRSCAAFGKNPMLELEYEYKRAELQVVKKTGDTIGIKSMGETSKTLFPQTSA